MDRRQFLQASTAAPLALVPTVLPAGTQVEQQRAALITPHSPTPNPHITVLCRPPENAGDRLMMALSENVFVRLTSQCGHALRLDDHVDKLGSVTARMVTMDQQMNCHVSLPTSLAGEHPPEFMYEDFQGRTNHWTVGQCLQDFDFYMLSSDSFKRFDPEESPPNVEELLKGKTTCALLPMPHGCLFVANYICSQTGLAMRAIGTYEMDKDHYFLRWDVLSG